MTVATRNHSGLWQARYQQVLLMFIGFSMAYALRVCMSVAIVAMMDSSSANPDFKDYEWSSTSKGYILGSFFGGYALTQIPSGQAAKKWNANKFLSIGIGLCAVASVFTPNAADAGWIWVCVCRIVMGLFQGCVLPCMHTLLANWAPPSERARLVTLTYSGPFFGTMVANALSGLLAESPGGWPSIFYVFAAMSIVWAIVFFVFGADSPGNHPWISDDEKRYIETSLGNVQDEKLNKKPNKTPWKAISRSAPVWALVAAHCGQNWGFWVIITEMSSYMKAILGFDMAENGLMAALPYMTMLILAFPASWLTDYAVKKGMSKNVLRKSANTIAQWGPGLAMIGMCYTDSRNTTVPVIIFIIAVAANIGTTCGFQMNHLDLSPNNAGVLMSITNFFASIVAIMAPVVVSAIVTDETNFSQWQIVFYLSAGIYFVCNTIFLVLGSTELQWWDDSTTVNKSSKNCNTIERTTDVSS